MGVSKPQKPGPEFLNAFGEKSGFLCIGFSTSEFEILPFVLSKIVTDFILLLLPPRNFKTNILQGRISFSGRTFFKRGSGSQLCSHFLLRTTINAYI